MTSQVITAVLLNIKNLVGCDVPLGEWTRTAYPEDEGITILRNAESQSPIVAALNAFFISVACLKPSWRSVRVEL